MVAMPWLSVMWVRCALRMSNRLRIRSFCTTSSSPSTVYALSSGFGKCGVSVIRVSGSEAGAALHRLTSRRTLPEPRRATLSKLRDPVSKQMLDKGLVFWYPGPDSYTGEDCCELHVHGSVAVVRLVLAALSKVPGLRPAQPGDFTKRAFLNNKLDLTEVEGVSDLIQAETEAQHGQAMRQVDGDVARLCDRWRYTLLQCVAQCEAYIDFSESDDIESEVISDVDKRLSELTSHMTTHLSDVRRGQILRSGVNLVITGPPNVGKSSLMNIICQRPASIVSHLPGTTRDIIESVHDVGGYPVVVSDTAGLRHDITDIIEGEGVRRTRNKVEGADLLLVMLDATKIRHARDITTRLDDLGILDMVVPVVRGGTGRDGDTLERRGPAEVVLVINKQDLCETGGAGDGTVERLSEVVRCCEVGEPPVVMSCHSGHGVADLLDRVTRAVATICDGGTSSGTGVTFTHDRSRYHLERCLRHISLCRQHLTPSHNVVTPAGQCDPLQCDPIQCDPVLAAHHLHRAVHHIGSITGRVRSDEILDAIFSQFCIGK